MTSIDPAQQAIIDEFNLFSDWMDRYQYIIDLGRKLPEFPEQLKTEDHRLHGCQSQVWLSATGDHNGIHFSAISDSSIVSGLIALMLRVYNDRDAQTILDTKPVFIEEIGLANHLSATRSNGLHALLQKICQIAAESLQTV